MYCEKPLKLRGFRFSWFIPSAGDLRICYNNCKAMKNTKAFLFVSVGILSLAILFSAGEAFGQRSSSWTPPTQQFPGGNTTPPVDVGDIDQSKSARLTTTGFLTTAPGASLSTVDGGYIRGGNNVFYPSASGASLLLNFTSPFIVKTKGLVLPNYSTTALGNGVPVGTITYNSGQAWLFTGPLPPPGGGGGNQSNNGLLNGANAQSNQYGQGWVPLYNNTTSTGGGGNTYNLSNAWLKNGGVVYNDPATSTAVAIGNNTSYPGILFTLGKPQGSSEPINFHIGGDQVIADNAYYNNGWQFNVGGDNKRATAIELGMGRINFKVSANESGSGISNNNGLVNSVNAQSGGAVQWVDALTINTQTGNVSVKRPLTADSSITARGSVTLAPAGTASYTIQNNYGTLSLMANGQTPRLSIGQDGATIFNGNLRTATDKLEYLGPLSTANSVYATTGQMRCLFLNSQDCGSVSQQNQYPSAPACSCSNFGQGSGTNVADGCANTGMTPNQPVGTVCTSFFNPVGGGGQSSLPGKISSIAKKLLPWVSETKAEETYGFHRYYRVTSVNSANFQLGGGTRSGTLTVMGPNGGASTLTTLNDSISVGVGSDPNTQQKLKMNVGSLVNSSGQGQCSGKFLTVDGSGNLVCQTPSAPQSIETVEMPGNRSDPGGFYGLRNGLNGTCGQASCEGTYDVGNISEYKGCFQTGFISRGSNTSACFIFRDTNAGKWKVRIFEWWDGAAFCKISCIK